MATKQHLHISIARGLSIILVAMAHLHINGLEPLISSLSVVRMPFFFLLAGLFFKLPQGVTRYALRKFVILLSPYFFVLLLIGLRQWHAGSIASGYLQGVFYANGQVIVWTPLWFLPHLCLLYILAAVLFKLSDFTARNIAWQYAVAAGLLLGGGAVLQLLQPLLQNASATLLQTGLPWGLDFVLVSLGYFTLGYLLRDYFVHARLNVLTLLCCSAVFFGMVAVTAATVDFNLRIYTPFYLVPLVVLPGCLMLLQLALLIKTVPYLRGAIAGCGHYSLYILIFHVFFQMQLTNHSTLAQHTAGQLALLLLSVSGPVILGWLIRQLTIIKYCFEPGLLLHKAVK